MAGKGGAVTGMFGCGGGAGIDVYGGGRRRRTVASNIFREPAPSARASTPASPAGDAAYTAVPGRPRGRRRGAVFARKQLPAPTPVASARSARPLPDTRLPRDHGCRAAATAAPGRSPRRGSKTIRLAVGKTAIPYRSLRVTRFAADDVLVAARDRDADADEARERRPDRHARPPAPGHRVPDDRRARLRRVRLVRVRVRDDPGAVAIPERVADDDARSRSCPSSRRPRARRRRARASRGSACTRRRSTRRRPLPRRSRGRPCRARRPRRRCRSRRRSTPSGTRRGTGRRPPSRRRRPEVVRRHVEDRDAVRVDDDARSSRVTRRRGRPRSVDASRS